MISWLVSRIKHEGERDAWFPKFAQRLIGSPIRSFKLSREIARDEVENDQWLENLSNDEEFRAQQEKLSNARQERLSEIVEFESLQDQDAFLCCAANPAQAEVYRLLIQDGFRLVRSNSHDVWATLDGKQRWTTPKTTSDFRSWQNNLSDYKNNKAGVVRYRTPGSSLTDEKRKELDEILKTSKKKK